MHCLCTAPVDKAVLRLPVSAYVSCRLPDRTGELVKDGEQMRQALMAFLQAKEYLPTHALRRILALQSELVSDNQTAPVDHSATATPDGQAWQPVRQRSLLSANFASPLQNGTKAAGAVGRNILSAGDKLRDLIVPDALATIISAPTGWIPNMGLGGGKRLGAGKDAGKQAEKLRADLDEILASNCPMCESVAASLDKPFVKAEELDTTWTL